MNFKPLHNESELHLENRRLLKMWRSTRRRTTIRQSNDMVGLISTEEAQIKKALMESLRSVSTKTYISDDDSSSDSERCRSSSPSQPGGPSPKQRKRKKKTGDSDSSMTTGPICGGTGTAMDRPALLEEGTELDSVVSSSLVLPYQHGSPCSSPEFSDNDSLRLVLSTSSKCSTCSSLVHTPNHLQDFDSPTNISPKQSLKKSPKAKRVLQEEMSTALVRRINKSKPLKNGKTRAVPLKQKGKHNLLHEEKCTFKELPKTKISKMNRKKRVMDSHEMSSEEVGKGKKRKRTYKKRTTNKVKQTRLPEDRTVLQDSACATAGTDSNDAAHVGNPTAVVLENCDHDPEKEKKASFSCTYPAQRKFASNHTPPTRNSQYDALDSLANFNEVPKTEDFITFLCLRGSASVPESLRRKFSQPWTPTYTQCVRARSCHGKISKGRLHGENIGVKKKLVYPTSNGSKLQSSISSGAPASN